MWGRMQPPARNQRKADAKPTQSRRKARLYMTTKGPESDHITRGRWPPERGGVPPEPPQGGGSQKRQKTLENLEKLKKITKTLENFRKNSFCLFFYLS